MKVWRAQVWTRTHATYGGVRVLRSRDFRTLRGAKLWLWIRRHTIDRIHPTIKCDHGCCSMGIYWRIARIADLDASALLRAVEKENA